MLPPPLPPPVPAQLTIVPVPPDTTLTYDQSAQLMADPTFQGRVRTACLKFATSIQNEDSTIPCHNPRQRWAQSCFMNPYQAAVQATPPTVLDPNVQTSGSDVSDEVLQGAVEAVVAKFF